nr:hypothetical protein [Allomuricauda sp.]
MKKSILALTFLLFTGIAFSQTTVTLQDQCNCEVLKGTDVSTSGAVTPTGADLGDIYVNTNTGTIYFWDGDSWELTATDDQQLTGFNFDGVTNTLSLTLENGGTVNVDLSSLSDVFTDTNTTIASFGIDGTNTNLVITDSEANTFAVALVDLAALINTDNQTLTEVLSQGNDAGGATITNLAVPVNPQDATTKAYVDSVADDDITGVSFDGGTNEVTVSEGGTSFSADLSSLDDSAGVAANAADIANNTTAIGNNATNITANASDIANNTTNISNNASAIATNASDIANNTTNISNNASAIATNTSDIANNTTAIGNNAANITTNATDIATNATNLANHISADGDLSDTNEIQNIEEVLTDGNDANGLVLTGLGAPTAASDAATKAYVDSVADDDITGVNFDGGTNEVTVSEGGTSFSADLSSLDDSAGVAANAADIVNNTTAIGNNASDISNNATNITTNATNISNNTTDIANNTTAIGNNASNISTNTTNISNNASAIATNTSDIANNTTNISNNASAIATNTSDIANNTTAIGNNAANITTNASDIANNTTAIGNNATDIANHIAADADTNIGNEYNTGSSITDGVIGITDGGGTESIDLISSDLNNNITFGSDGALYLNVASVSIAETNTSLSYNDATGELTYSNELGNNPVVDISGLDDSAGVAANAADIANNTTAIGNNATNITANATDIATNATNLANHISADGDLSDTNEIQNIEEVLTDGNDANGLVLTGLGAPTAGSDAATKAYVDSVADDDITGVSFDGGTNEVTVSEGSTSFSADLSSLDDSAGVAANAADIANNTTNISNNASAIATNASDIANNTTAIGNNAADIVNNTANISNNASAIATNTSDIANNATNLANHISADGDLSDTNEIQNIEEVLTDGNDANGLVLTGLGAPTAGSDAATKAYVDSVADDDITGVSFDGGTNEVTVSEGGTSFSADLSSLDDSAGVAANAADIANNTTAIGNNAADIANNTTNISNNTSAIATNTSDIANNATNLANHISADGDLSDTNEIQNIEEVLTDGNDANGLVLTGLGAPTAGSDAATKAYVDSVADDDITGVSFDGGTNEVTVSEGGTSFSADLSSLDDSAGVAANAADIANNTTNISNNTSAIATNASDIANNATNLANHISADGDLSDTNEIQNIEEVLTDGNDANGLVLTGLGAPTAASDAATKAYVDSVADDDITGVSFDAGTNEVTVSEGGTSFSADLSSLDDSAGVAANAADIANNTAAIGNNAANITTNTSDIANNTTAIGNNATDIANHIAADADMNIGNEYNTGSSITDGVIGITDGGGTESIDLISSDLNNNITFGSDGALYLNVASVSIAETNTSLSYNDATGELTYSNELGNNPVVDISGLDDSAGVAANAADIANNATAIGNNASDISNNATNITTNATNISNNTTAIGNNAANITTNATDIATNATNLANHISADGDLSDTNEIQNIEEVLTDGNDANGLVLTGLGAPTAASDAATKAYVDSVADDDITGVSFDGGTNEVTVSEGSTSFSADLSSLDDSAGVAANATDITNNTTAIGNNATDISNNATNISNNTTAIGNNATNITANATDIATNATNLANHISADGDLSDTNEIQNIEEVLTDGNDANGLVLTGLGAPTAASDAATKAYVDSVADDDITGVSFDGGTNEVTVSEGSTSFSADLSSLDDSAGVAANAADIANNTTAIGNNASDISNNATNISNNTTAIGNNASNISTNTTNISNNASAIATNTTDIATNATNLANHISADGDLSDTNEIQNIEEVLTDGNDANGLVLTGLGAPTAASDAATKAYVDSVADDDITGVSFDGGTNEVTVSEGSTSFSADLSSLDDSAGVAANATDIANNTTAIGNNATDISNNASNISNNTTAIGNNATNITANATDIATNATNLANHISADGDLSDTNEIQNIEEVLTDGNDANGLVLTGLGAPTAASDAATKAYVDSVADDDITGVSFDGGTNEVTVSEGGTSFSADLSSLDDSAGVAANATDIANNTTAIGNNATDISNNTTNISNNASAIATNTTDIATNATNLANHISADGDLSDTNEIQNIEEVLTDGNDANGLVLTGLGAPTAGSDAATKAYVDSVADDDITGVSFDGGTNEVTVSEGSTSFSADLSSLDDSAGVAANAADIANNTTAIGNNATDISNNATNISNNTTAIGNNASNITTNASDIANNTTAIGNNASAIATNTTDIATNATNLANHISADGDLSDTNEIQNIEEVLTDGNDANGLVLTGLGAPTAGSDAATKAYVDSVADDDITGVSFDGGTNEVTVSEGGTSFSADLSSLDDSAGVAANAADIANNTTNISNNASAIATNTTDIATNATNLANHISADGDLSDTNEINTRFEVNGANLEIEDSNGTLQVPLADINNQDASEVNSDSPVDVDGDGNTESTVEDVIQDIARITSKAARIFYPPSIAIDASTNGAGRTINLYSQYLAQYGSPTVRSAGAPAAIPTYGATELYYYVTYADPTVFANMTIDANGVLTYDIIGQPADYNALINVVFVVK